MHRTAYYADFIDNTTTQKTVFVTVCLDWTKYMSNYTSIVNIILGPGDFWSIWGKKNQKSP